MLFDRLHLVEPPRDSVVGVERLGRSCLPPAVTLSLGKGPHDPVTGLARRSASKPPVPVA